MGAVENAGAGAAAAAALAAMIASGVVAWQAERTREAAQATTENTRLTREALALNEKSLLVSQSLAVEAVRARLDAGLPRLRVELRPPKWPPLEMQDQGEPQPIPAGQIYRLPRDAARQVVLEAPVVVSNLADFTVRFSFSGNILREGDRDSDGPREWYEPAGYQILRPGNSTGFLLRLTAPVETWQIVGEQQIEGTAPAQDPAGIGTVVYSDSHNCGVSVVYQLRIGGFPLEPVPNEDSALQLVDPDALSMPHPFLNRSDDVGPLISQPVLADRHLSTCRCGDS